MRDWKFSRRAVLKLSTVPAAGVLFPAPLAAAAPESTPISPALIEAARRDGAVAFYTAMEIPVAETLARTFEAKYPGITVHVKRSGAERVFQRIEKEEEIHLHEVDVVCSTDAAHFVYWKRDGLLAPYVPEDAARHLPTDQIDADGMYATAFALLSPIGYNTNLVKPEEAPKSFADLLDPRWKGRIIKANPAYSGTILTATFELARDLGWSFFEKLAGQQVAQVLSALDPPKKLALGESAVQADGADSNLLLLKERGAPVEAVYANGGHAVDHGTERRFPERAEAQRRALVPELPVQCRGAAASGRRHRSVLIPCAGAGKARTPIAVKDQADEKRSGGHGGAERRHQGPLQPNFRGVI